MQLDYTFERQLELEREAASEATDRAWQQGRTEGRSEGLYCLYKMVTYLLSVGQRKQVCPWMRLKR